MSLKDPILTFFQNKKILILLQLKDGRLLIYSEDRSIRIYNRNYSISYIISKIKSQINSMIQTEDEKLICSSYEITIFKLNKKNYEIIQLIKVWTNKIIEISDKDLIAIQNSSIRFYSLENNRYNLIEESKFEENVDNIIKIKDNDVCLLLDNYNKFLSINIYNIETKNIFKLYETKNKESGEMCIIQDKYLIVSLYLCLILIDIEKDYKIINEIRTSFGCVNTFCFWKDSTFFSGDDIGDIIEWKINKNKIIKIKEYNNSKKAVNSIIGFKNKLIVVGSNDGFIKFYKLYE